MTQAESMVPEVTVRLAGTLYDARRAMRTLLGPKYAEEIAQMTPILQRFAVHIGTDNILAAATQLALRVDRNDAMEKLLILATAVELLEPSQADGDEKYERR
jgi:galactokinase